MSTDPSEARNRLSADLRRRLDIVLEQLAKEYKTSKENVLLTAQQGLDRMRREHIQKQTVQ